MGRRRRRSSLLGKVYFLVLAGLGLGAALWFDRRGELVAATVLEKREEITVSHVPQGWWHRWYRLDVEFPTRDLGPMRSTVSVPLARYDSLRRGDPLEIRYLPAFPLLARTADRSTVSIALDLASALAAGPFVLPFLIWMALGVVGLWIASRVGTPVIVLVGAAWIAAAFPLLFRSSGARSLEAPAGVRTMARVGGVTLVTRAPQRTRARRATRGVSRSIRRLSVPYQVVQLRLVAPGWPDSVLAVDAVDSGSVAGLAMGATLPVRYDARNPRNARLSVGARTFLDRNRYHYRVPILVISGVGMLFAWGARGRRRRKTQATNPAPPS